MLVLVAYGSFGFRHGVVYSIGALLGLVLGSVVAFLVLPHIGALIPQPLGRIIVVVAVLIALIAGGHALGTGIAASIDRSVKGKGVKAVNRVLGAVVNIVAAALVVAVLSSSLVSLGIPILSRVVASSTVLRLIGSATPDPVEAFLAQLRSTVVTDGLPAIQEALGGITETPVLPEGIETGSQALTAAAQSVVRISGTAPDCAQNQSGSGFVVSSERIITNAHVVAGVKEPLVETPAGEVLTGRVVYFDPNDDLAVIAVPGLKAKPLALASTVATGMTGVIDGYPFGGPFVTSAAEVLAVTDSKVNDIYATSASQREVYSLATTVNEGDSGGPFLDNGGRVVGVVFAKSANTPNLGYAMTMAEVQPVADLAPELTGSVTPGVCSRG